MVIFKYPLLRVSLQEVIMLKDSQILTVQVQGEDLFIWALCNEQESLRQARTIEIIMTGAIVYDANRKYIATAQIPTHKIEQHVFERI